MPYHDPQLDFIDRNLAKCESCKQTENCAYKKMLEKNRAILVKLTQLQTQPVKLPR